MDPGVYSFCFYCGVSFFPSLNVSVSWLKRLDQGIQQQPCPLI